MFLAVLSLIPVGLGFFLLAFGVPGCPFLAPTPRNLAGVAIAAVVLGPVAQIAVGFAGWLALMGIVIIGVVLATGMKNPTRGGALQE